MENKTLSYIIATRNKLPYLRGTLEKLILNKKEDEEILIGDGNSTDGTREYLAELKNDGKIDFYVSEKDYGLAHALNKLVLASKGTLIKYLSDDDAFDYETIQKCKDFMLKNPKIDLLNTEGGSLNNPSRILRENNPLQIVRALNYAEKYRKWQTDHIPFYFCDLGMIFRKSSLPVIGFWNPIFPGPDIEISLRTSAGKVAIAWYTGYSYVNISNPQSVSMVHMKKTQGLTERLSQFYFNENPDFFIIKKIKAIKNIIKKLLLSKDKHVQIDFQATWPKLVEVSEKWLSLKNRKNLPEFIWKK
jgi:glycosyltransferase involved in cell wall biosynthesis